VEKLLARLRLGNLVVAATAMAVGMGVLGFFRQSLPREIPLFYSLPWGEEQLATPLSLIWPIGLSVGVSLGGVVLTRFLKNDPVLAVIVTGSGIMIGIIMILAVLRSVMLVV
jgi:hypothetical protein